MLKRTITCGELTSSNLNETVVLNGWINSRRDHGGLIFIDLRDRYGITQVVFDPEAIRHNFSKAKKLGLEDVIAVKGKVRKRPEGAINPKLPTGEIEVLAQVLEILNESEPLPFLITDRSTGLEELRLKYRYLDLRTKELQRTIRIRNKTYQSVRNYYLSKNFYEIETPFLMRSTPEGARDFLVPSRIHKGKFYALPQSPQTYKQLLMIAGFDKYFQIVRCFRDEDLRADRQPEFTQIDVEMSFIEEEDVIKSTEKMLITVFKEVINVELESPFPQMKFEEAVNRYGSDKPDLRFGCEVHNISKIAEETDFNVFRNTVSDNGIVAGICVPNESKFSRKIIDNLTEKVKQSGVKGLAFVKVSGSGFESSIARFLKPVEKEIISEFNANKGDIIFFIADKENTALTALGNLRSELAQILNLIPKNAFKPVWITNFPLLEWNEEEQRYTATHHPFTSYVPEEENLLDREPEKVHARAYDIVINGAEIGGGSIRNNTTEKQMKVFKALGIDKNKAMWKFGFLLDALKFGAPPHGGIALGFDRLVAILSGVDNIREVIAFPKTTSAASLMDGSPSEIEEEQLKELGLRTIE
jgi:aspartyl-tRNA synthetase